jgi:tRNA U54 and U55 pseudouridine synthase Pus10
MEFSKVVYPWEQNFIKSFSYYIQKFLVGIPCEERTPEEKNTERWYFYLENETFKAEIKQHLGKLYKLFTKYKVKDLKVSECTCTTDFIKMCKDLQIIPVFLTTKDVINVK